MKINLVAIGGKMPAWVEAGTKEYQKRLPRNFELLIKEVALARRSKSNANIEKLCSQEGKALLKEVSDDSHIVALDVKGKVFSTESLAIKIKKIMESGRDITLLAGGPDGLSDECLKAADEIWSLSALTLPHPLVRIVVAQQIYRVWSLLSGHPYHRE